MIPYLLYVGNSHCHDCGKAIKKIYVVRGKQYGSECVKKHLNVEVPDDSISIPVWVLEVANRYVDFRMQDAKRRNEHLESVDDFIVNFFNIDFGVEMKVTDKWGNSLVANNQPIKINGKTVKVAWCWVLYDYLAQKRREVSAIHPL